MRIINYQTNPNLYFSSRNKKIKKADKIVRKTRQEFCALSPSYAENYWLSLRQPKHSDLARNFKIFIDKLSTALSQCRITYDFKEEILEDTLAIQKTIKEYKVANCAEYAELIEATLLANNCPNSKLAQVIIQLNLYDKLTGDKLYEFQCPYDHMIVLSSLDDKKGSEEEMVLDGWIGKAMSISEAKREYLTMLTKQDEKQIFLNGLDSYNLFLDSIQENHDPATLDDIDFRIKIFFKESKKSFLREQFEKDPEKTSRLLHLNYPNLLLDNK